MKLGTYCGYIVIEDINLEEIRKKTVKRSFFERVFSLTPFQKYKEISTCVPSDEIIIDDSTKTIVIHPEKRHLIKGLPR